MVTPEDLKANADYIKIADFVCKVKGTEPLDEIFFGFKKKSRQMA